MHTAGSSTIERVVIVRSGDYWAGVAATLTEDLAPKRAATAVLHAVSADQFAEVHARLDRTSLYYPTGWQLDVGPDPVLHDDLLVSSDPTQLDDAALIAAVRARLAVEDVCVVGAGDAPPLVGDALDAAIAEALGPSTLDADRSRVAARTWLSLGGWCGPAIGLRRLLGPAPRQAFDYLLSSLPGVDEALLGDGEGYVPPNPFPMVDVTFNRPDDVEARNIIGSEHWALPEFIHIHERFDLYDDVWERLDRRLDRSRALLRDHDGPLFVMRSFTSNDWQAERDLFVDVVDRLAAAHPNLELRPIAVVHSQRVGTVRLAPMAPGIDTWAVMGAFGSLDDTGLPFMRYEAEYARLFCRIAADDDARCADPSLPWPPRPDLPVHTLHDHNEHWIF